MNQQEAMYLTSAESEAEKKEIKVYLEQQGTPELWKIIKHQRAKYQTNGACHYCGQSFIKGFAKPYARIDLFHYHPASNKGWVTTDVACTDCGQQGLAKLIKSIEVYLSQVGNINMVQCQDKSINGHY